MNCECHSNTSYGDCCRQARSHHGHRGHDRCFDTGGFLSKGKRIEVLERQLAHVREQAEDIEAYIAELKEA